MLLQEGNKVLERRLVVSQGCMRELTTVGQDVLTCFHLAMATRTVDALCREKTLFEFPNGSIVENSSSHPGT